MEGKDDQSKTMPIPIGNKKDEIKTPPEAVPSKVAPQNVGDKILESRNILQDNTDVPYDKESVLEKKDSYEVRTMQHDIDEAKGKKLKSVNIAREAPENLAKRGVIAKGVAMSNFENSKLTRQDVEEGVIGKTDESIKIKKTKISFLAKVKSFLFRRKMEQENQPKKTGLVIALILLVFIGGAGYYLYTSGTFSSLGDMLRSLFEGGAQPPTPTSTLPLATTTTPPILPNTTSSTSTLPIIPTTTLDFIKSGSFFSPDEEEIVYINRLEDLYTGIQESYYKDLGSGKFRRIIVAAKNDFSNLSSSVNLGQIWKSVKALALGGDKYSELVSAEVVDNLGLAMPTSVYKNISEKYNIFFYGQPDDNSSRVVLVFKLNSLDGAEQSMLSWESTILYDLKNIFLGKEHGIQSTDTFQDNYYKNTHIRYLNLPEPTLTMDYTIFTEGEYFVLTTSREAAWATIDKLLGEKTPSIEDNIDTSAWKTYKNDQYGFEIKYPAKALITTDQNDEEFSLVNIFSTSSNSSFLFDGVTNIEIDIGEKKGEYILDEKCISPLDIRIDGGAKDLQANQIAGINFIKEDGFAATMGGNETAAEVIGFTTEKNNVCISINFIYSVKRYGTNLSFDDEIKDKTISSTMNTFRFTE
ncbi:MAG: hypothetical protein WC242_02905 [Candidatus Paceibacterota bacterium]|jgi:hypothetical protein